MGIVMEINTKAGLFTTLQSLSSKGMQISQIRFFILKNNLIPFNKNKSTKNNDLKKQINKNTRQPINIKKWEVLKQHK